MRRTTTTTTVRPYNRRISRALHAGRTAKASYLELRHLGRYAGWATDSYGRRSLRQPRG